MDHESPVRVLQSFRPNAATNPYLLQLVRALEDYVTVETFSWRTALLGRYDVFHIHWPEVLVSGGSRPRTAARTVLFFAVLLVARARRRVIVRTLHNVAPHDPPGGIRRRLLALCDRWTSGWISLTSAAQGREPNALIPHGHYRDWYRPPSGVAATSGKVILFGNIRRYKGIDELLAAVAQCDVEPFTLRIVGRPLDDESATAIGQATSNDARVSARLEYLEDSELAGEIAASSLVVLPYRDLVNSGAALLALSLDRPVLVPSTPSAIELQDEIGQQWVMTYSPPLTGSDLAGALALANAVVGSQRPDLSRRNWDQAARAHRDLYVRAQRSARHYDPTMARPPSSEVDRP